MVFLPIYKTCSPSQYLAVTGWSIDGTVIAKKRLLFPGQQFRRLDICPENYEFDIQAMSSEKLPFKLPAVFTIGPNLNTEDLVLYAQLIGTHSLNNMHVADIIKGIVEGETRVLAAGMTMEKIFMDTKEFKQNVFEKVQLELNQFGLKIYNANIKQLSDLPGHEYFSFLGKKIQKGAENQAKIDIAQADYLGNVGSQEREGQTTRNVCKIKNETELFELEQAKITQSKKAETLADIEIKRNQAAALVAIEKAKLDRNTKIANIEAEKQAQITEANLENELNVKQAQATTEKFRSENFSRAVVDAEINTAKADAAFYTAQRDADAIFYARSKQLDAFLLQKQKEAESVAILAEAQARAVDQMVKAFNGDVAGYLQWKMLEDGLYEKLAVSNANAIQGLKPNISIWNTGSEGGSGDKGLIEFFKSIPPIFSTIEQQSGMSLLPSLVNNHAAAAKGKSPAA
ncbi:hypothetical protein DFS34DRAFT_185866 [Phlyctochytrium arcticum]|nr:hypothetical protein DFS34DRAFT_185866 [Phlyctochytrium arcticum]